MPKYTAPDINKEFTCICDADQQVLGAVISSYVNIPQSYFALFEFPGITTAKQKYDVENVDEHTFSQHRANQFEVFLNNILARMNFSGTVILAGLSSDQKSFIRRYATVTYIEIDKLEDVDFYLSPFLTQPREKLLIREDEVLIGLRHALREEKILSIDERADPLYLTIEHQTGLIVIEDEQKARSLTAVNYAYAVDADICIVSSLGNKAEYEIQHLLSDWDNGSTKALAEIEQLVNERVGQIDFPKYKWATFFTQGLPYSLVLKNVIPCTYISCHYNPDLFIANALLYEKMNAQGGAVVFSPLFFQDEETKMVGDFLLEQNYYVRGLIGRDANVKSLRMHLIQFPYDIFHMCSHGGELKGNLIVERFTDRFGKEHTVEYEHVLGFSAGNENDMISVQQLMFPKKLDGKIWGSSELVDVYPSEIFSDMHNSMRRSDATQKAILRKDIVVANSSHIQCYDSVCMPLFETLASHSSPIIFNNSCTSWFNMAMPFIAAGSRAYIGTLCTVNTQQATEFAKAFYLSAKYYSLSDSLHKARVVNKGEKAENIYIMWGLHFSVLQRMPKYYESKRNVFAALSIALGSWIKSMNKERSERTKGNIEELISWIRSTLISGWTKEERERYRSELKK